MSKKDCEKEMRVFYDNHLDGLKEHSSMPTPYVLENIKGFLDKFIESDVESLNLNELDDFYKRNIKTSITDFFRRFGEGGGYFIYKGVYIDYANFMGIHFTKTTLEKIMENRDNHVKSYDQYPHLYESQIHIINDIYAVRDLEKILDTKWLEKYTSECGELYDKLVDLELKKQEYFTVKDTLLSTENCRPND